MPILNLSEAVDFYFLVESYLPELKKEQKVIDYVYDLLNNMKKSPHIYIEALQQLSGMSEEAILELDGTELFDLFVQRLLDNRIGYLQAFMKRFVDDG